MRAVAIQALGGPEVLEVIEVPEPSPNPGEVIIEVEATSYNNVDALLRREDFGLNFPVIPGSDVVGRIISEDSTLHGSRVVVNPGLPCGSCESCMSGKQCPYVRILGVHQQGAYAERIAVGEKQCFAIPDELPREVAAAFPLTFLTAWRMLITKAHLSQGQTVLVWGASGGLGSAAIAISKALSAGVIAVVTHGEQIIRISEYGADHVIEANDPNFSELVKSHTSGHGVDVVFEGPGSATWQRSVESVGQGGCVVTAGVTSGSLVELDVEDLYYRQISILGSRMGYQEEFVAVLKLLLEKRIRPLIDSVTPLSDAVEVHRRAAIGDRCGKMVLYNDL